MADKRRFLDVWIVETNTVYKEVPFTVVADWVQQGRLLEDDRLRPSGTADWQRLGDVPAFAAYLPKPTPFRAEDKAEALEPVQLDFSWKRRHDDEDEDVDMIPLIDVSLVLLIFFIMTAASGAAAGFPFLARAGNAAVAENADLWVGIARDGDAVVYSVGQRDKPAEDQDKDLRTPEALLARFDALLAEKTRAIDVAFFVNDDVRAAVKTDLLEQLNARRQDKKSGQLRIRSVRDGVNER
jgi:biopolymer transport protein ExbD